MKCSTCGKEVEDVKYCSICKAPICLDCVHYVGVRKKTIYKEYDDAIPVCKNCLPKIKLKGKLVRILDEVFREGIDN